MFSNPVGVRELNYNHESISVYPNPTDEVVNVKLEKANAISFTKLFIYNSLGQLVREEEIVFKEKEITVSTSDLPPGIYQLKFSSEVSMAIRISKKFVVSR